MEIIGLRFQIRLVSTKIHLRICNLRLRARNIAVWSLGTRNLDLEPVPMYPGAYTMEQVTQISKENKAIEVAQGKRRDMRETMVRHSMREAKANSNTRPTSHPLTHTQSEQLCEASGFPPVDFVCACMCVPPHPPPSVFMGDPTLLSMWAAGSSMSTTVVLVERHTHTHTCITARLDSSLSSLMVDLCGRHSQLDKQD